MWYIMKYVPQTGRFSLYEIVGVNFHLAEISIQPTEALFFYIQIGSSVHLHSIKACYFSVFIRSAIPRRTENVCDICQLDSICLFSLEMEFQRLHPIYSHTLSRHEKLSVKFGQSDGKTISLLYLTMNSLSTQKWHSSCSGMHDALLHCITTFLLNKSNLAKIISEKVPPFFFFPLGLCVCMCVCWFSYWSRGKETVIDKYCLITAEDMASYHFWEGNKTPT